MKFALPRALARRSRKQATSEVEDELHFHIEMLERKYAQQGMTDVRARAAALRRFGNLERIRNQCVDISRRSSPLRRVLKVSSILLALAGLAIHASTADYKVARVGTMLITIAIAGRLLLYVRGLSPWTYLSGAETSSSVTDTPQDAART